MSLCRILGPLAGIVLTACSVEVPAKRSPGNGDAKADAPRSTDAEQDISSCRVTSSKGCFDGHIVSKAEFRVDGRSFFNADDFAARFCELLDVAVEGVSADACQNAKLVMTTPTDLQNFAAGFEYYLQGDAPRSGKLRNNGNFSINELPEGVYRLRMQKAIHFQLTRVHGQKPSPPAGEIEASERQDESAATRQICATLYADADVEVRRAQRSWDNFNEFKLHVTDRECASSALPKPIHL